MKGFLTTIVALMFMGVALPAASQARRSEEFKDKYKLKEAVVLSRHNIRSPLSDSKSDLGRMTPHEWTKWSAGKSELTSRGGALETMMGNISVNGLLMQVCFPKTIYRLPTTLM